MWLVWWLCFVVCVHTQIVYCSGGCGWWAWDMVGVAVVVGVVGVVGVQWIW